jgi:hypothetical protein
MGSEASEAHFFVTGNRPPRVLQVQVLDTKNSKMRSSTCGWLQCAPVGAAGTTGRRVNGIRPPFPASTLYGYILASLASRISRGVRGGCIHASVTDIHTGKHSKRDLLSLGVLYSKAGIVGPSYTDAICRCTVLCENYLQRKGEWVHRDE